MLLLVVIASLAFIRVIRELDLIGIGHIDMLTTEAILKRCSR